MCRPPGGHHALAPADLAPVPDPGDHRRPQLRRAHLELVQHGQRMSASPSRSSSRSAVGLMNASRPSPSTVITPERMFRRMSSASSRTRCSSVARVACSIPASRRRWPSTATIANTRLNTSICAQKATSGASARVQSVSPRKSAEASTAVRAPIAGGMSSAYAATTSTYSAGNADCGCPAKCTTVVTTPRSTSAWIRRNVCPARRPRRWTM